MEPGIVYSQDGGKGTPLKVVFLGEAWGGTNAGRELQGFLERARSVGTLEGSEVFVGKTPVHTMMLTLADGNEKSKWPDLGIFRNIARYYRTFIKPGAADPQIKKLVHGWLIRDEVLVLLKQIDFKDAVRYTLKAVDESPWTIDEIVDKFRDRAWIWELWRATMRVWSWAAYGEWERLAQAFREPLSDPLARQLVDARNAHHAAVLVSADVKEAYDTRLRKRGRDMYDFGTAVLIMMRESNEEFEKKEKKQKWYDTLPFLGIKSTLESMAAFFGLEYKEGKSLLDVNDFKIRDGHYLQLGYRHKSTTLADVFRCAVESRPPVEQHIYAMCEVATNHYVLPAVAALIWRHQDIWPERVIAFTRGAASNDFLGSLRWLPVLYDAKTNAYSTWPDPTQGLPIYSTLDSGAQSHLVGEALFWIHPEVKRAGFNAYMNPILRNLHKDHKAFLAAAAAAEKEGKEPSTKRIKMFRSEDSSAQDSRYLGFQKYPMFPLDRDLVANPPTGVVREGQVHPQVTRDVSIKPVVTTVASFLGKPEGKAAPFANLEARVDLKDYGTDIPVWAVIYSQRLFSNGCEKAKMRNRSRDAAALPPLYLRLRELHPDDSFWVYVYAERHLCPGEKKTCPRYITRVGFADVPIHQLDQDKSVSLYDINGHTVGQVTLTVKDATMAVDPEAAEVPPVFDVDKLVQETEQQRKRFSGSNITPKLQHLERLVVKQHFGGSIPMWAFCLLHLPNSEPLESLNYYEQAVINAKHLLGISGEIPHTLAVEAEMLNEMQTLATRGQLYVPDTTKTSMSEASVDDWTSPLVAAEQKLLGIDCEDAALRIVQDAWWWLQAPRTRLSPEAERLAKVEAHYITFFVAMTLKVAGVFKGQSSSAEWVYHAAALKLDRSYVLQKLGLETPQTQKRERLPAVLLEGTAYTTGCWDYVPIHKAEADKVSFQSQANFSKGDTISKVTPTMMRRKDLYGHILSMFSPELALDYGVVEISLSQDNKLGASAKEVMRYSDQVEWHPIKLENVQERLEPLKSWAYPPVQEPQVTSGIVAYPKPKLCDIDFLLREVDWNADTQKELEANFGRKLHATRIQIADDLAVWQICSS